MVKKPQKYLLFTGPNNFNFPKSEDPVLCVNSVNFQNPRVQILCQLCNLPGSTHTYPGDQTNVVQVIMCCVLC